MLLKMVREIKVWNVHQRDMKLIKFHLNFHKGTTPEASFWIQKTNLIPKIKVIILSYCALLYFGGLTIAEFIPFF